MWVWGLRMLRNRTATRYELNKGQRNARMTSSKPNLNRDHDEAAPWHAGER
jgi:hypothetical protein